MFYKACRPAASPRIWLLGMLMVAVCALAGCGKGEAQTGQGAPAGGSGKPGPAGEQRGGPPAKPRDPVEVRVAPVRMGQLEESVRIVGTLFGTDEITISAEAAGRMQTAKADIGDRIAPGEELARIDPTDYELEVQQAENALNEALARLSLTKLPEGRFDVEAVPTVARGRAQAHNAQVKLDRARALFERQPPLLSAQEFADIETAHEVAASDYQVAKMEAESQLAVARSRRSALEAAREKLRKTFVKAPPIEHASTTSASTFAVTARHIAAGEYVKEADRLYDLVLDDPIKLRGDIPERYLGSVVIDQEARINVESQKEPFVGRVARINPAVDPQSRAFQVEINFPNGGHELRPGAFATGSIVTGSRSNIPHVPRAAVISFAGVDRVFSVKEGKAEEHVVELGALEKDEFVILKGLEGVSSVIVEGNQRLAKGDPVITKP